jgi:hypothetical protein
MTPQIKVYTHAFISETLDLMIARVGENHTKTCGHLRKIQPDRIICFLLTFKRPKIDVSIGLAVPEKECICTLFWQKKRFQLCVMHKNDLGAFHYETVAVPLAKISNYNSN